MNEKLTLQDLVDLLAQKAKISKKEADAFFKELFAIITESVYENEPVKIKDFGVFKLTPVSSRESVNVNTGEKIEIPAHYRLSFQPDKTLKELVNKPFASFETILLDDEEGAGPPAVPVAKVSEPKQTQVAETIIKDVIIDEDDHDNEKEVEVEVADVKVTTTPPIVQSKEEETKLIEVSVSKVEVKVQPKVQVEKKEDISETAPSRQTHNNLSVSPKYVYTYTTSQAESLADNDITVSNFIEKTLVTSPVVDKFEDFEKQVTPKAIKVEEDLPILKVPVEEPEEEPILVPVSDVEDKQELPNNLSSPFPANKKEDESLGDRGLLPEYDLDEDDYDNDEDDIEDEIDYNAVPDFYTQKPSIWRKIGRKIPVILFVLLATGAIIYSFIKLFEPEQQVPPNLNLTPADTYPTGERPDMPKPASLDSVLDETSKKLDSLKNDQKNEPVIADPYTTSQGVNIENVNKAEEKYKSQQNTPPAKIGSEVLKSGVTLRNLAEKYYGQGVFWVYIYEENKNVISDPDNIPVGVTVNIPSPAKYEIDAKSKASRDEAKQLESQVISEARQKRFARGGIR